MKIIDRYLGSQLLTTLSWAVGLLTMILVLGNVLRDLINLLLSRQLPISYILSFIGYLLPFSLTYSIPWGVLVAVLLVFGKLSSDNELVALRANGIGMLRICSPVLYLALALTGVCLWINLYVAPIAQVKLKSALFDLASHDPLALFGSDEVIDQFPNRKIYVGKKEGSVLRDLFIFEMNSQYLPMRIINASKGTLEVDKENQQVLLRVFDARYEERDETAPEDLKKLRHGITMREGVFPISLEELIRKARSNQRPNELTLDQLHVALSQTNDKEDDAAFRTEVSKRFSNAMAVCTFALIGVPLAITAQRRETSVGIALSLA
ncbi:MAG: LptF/LptG family permease, partial [Verrucomicrobia bacterium]|nr:LptF/LptG family permease [Verrucomicrobiota bacterium]